MHHYICNNNNILVNNFFKSSLKKENRNYVVHTFNGIFKNPFSVSFYIFYIAMCLCNYKNLISRRNVLLKVCTTPY